MPRATILQVRNGKDLNLVYAKKNPTTGAYRPNTEITAVAVEIQKADGSILTPTNAPSVTYYTTAGGFKGYRVMWTPATDLNGLAFAMIVLTPTLNGVAPALAMPKEYELDLSDVVATLGSPAGASVSVDIAAVKADAVAIKGSSFTPGSDDLHSLRLELDADEVALTATINTRSTPAQITAAQTAIIAEVDLKAAEIEGAGFVAATDTLHALRLEMDTDETAILNRLGAPAGASVSADIAAIRSEQDTDETAILASIAALRSDLDAFEVLIQGTGFSGATDSLHAFRAALNTLLADNVAVRLSP